MYIMSKQTPSDVDPSPQADNYLKLREALMKGDLESYEVLKSHVKPADVPSILQWMAMYGFTRMHHQAGAIGVIFHWGIYAVPGYAPVKANPQGLYNGSEWYMLRHMKGDPYHQKVYGNMDYFDFAKQFTPKAGCMKTWMQLCKAVGATYVILTARHHDGFCLWPSKVTKHVASRDLLKEFREAALAEGLIFGVYYSWMEFGKGVTKAYLKEVVAPQIEELIAYQPSIWWFDGHWELRSQHSQSTVMDLCKLIKHSLPNTLINDRIAPVSQGTNKGDYTVSGDRSFPETELKEWEHINTIGCSWGYNRFQKRL